MRKTINGALEDEVIHKEEMIRQLEEFEKKGTLSRRDRRKEINQNGLKEYLEKSR